MTRLLPRPPAPVRALGGLLLASGLLGVPQPGGAQEALNPSWSPDGQRLAYAVFDEGGGSELWTVGLDGRGPRRLTGTPDARELHPATGDQGSPAPSPDGRNVAFHSDHEGAYGIYLLRLEEGVVVPVAAESAP